MVEKNIATDKRGNPHNISLKLHSTSWIYRISETTQLEQGHLNIGIISSLISSICIYFVQRYNTAHNSLVLLNIRLAKGVY